MTPRAPFTVSFALLTAAAILWAGASQACFQPVQSCQGADGFEPFFGGQSEELVLFSQWGDYGTRSFGVVDCDSRLSLLVSAPTRAHWPAIEAAFDLDDAVGTGAVTASLKVFSQRINDETGVWPQPFILAEGNCACDLPHMPAPPPRHC